MALVRSGLLRSRRPYRGAERLLRVPVLHWSETVEADPGDGSPRVHLVCSASLRPLSCNP